MNKPGKKIFCLDEKQIILNFIKKYKGVIENKANDAKTVKARKEKWKELSQILTAKGYDRDWQRLREYYHRMKCSAKSAIASYRKYVNKSGILPDQAPSQFDWEIHDISPKDFDDEDNEKTDTEISAETVYIKQDHSEDTVCEQMNYDDKSEDQIIPEPTKIQEKRKSSLNCDILKNVKILKSSNSDTENYSNTQLALLEQSQRFGLELQKQRLEFAREKHKKDMENANLIEQKLNLELDTAMVNKMKMEKEVAKLDLELNILRRKLNSY